MVDVPYHMVWNDLPTTNYIVTSICAPAFVNVAIRTTMENF